jgi:hypothetical protein
MCSGASGSSVLYTACTCMQPKHALQGTTPLRLQLPASTPNPQKQMLLTCQTVQTHHQPRHIFLAYTNVPGRIPHYDACRAQACGSPHLVCANPPPTGRHQPPAKRHPLKCMPSWQKTVNAQPLDRPGQTRHANCAAPLCRQSPGHSSSSCCYERSPWCLVPI